MVKHQSFKQNKHIKQCCGSGIRQSDGDNTHAKPSVSCMYKQASFFSKKTQIDEAMEKNSALCRCLTDLKTWNNHI